MALTLPGVVVLDLAIPAQIFGHPDEASRYGFSVCAETPGLVPTSMGVPLQARGIGELRRADTVVIPGYAPLDEPSATVTRALRRAAERGARMMSVCTGAFALAAAGLLDGLVATTHWQDADELAHRHPTVRVDPDVLYVDNGQVLTSAGVCAGIDLCLHVVRTDHGAQIADRIARRLVVAPHRSGGQAQFIRRPLPSPGASLKGTCDWAAARIDRRLTVADMARHAGYAPRTFARRFVQETGTTPQQWITGQRVMEARRLLEGTDLSVDTVALRCGLGTAANLRIHLARDANTTPSAYRRAFRGADRPDGEA